MNPAKISILLADDDATFRKALAGALERRGHAVFAAGGGDQALALLQNEHQDVALLDLKMPGMDGLKLLQEIRGRRQGLPVVILTGHGTIPSAIEAIHAGAAQYLQKPCAVDEVEKVLLQAVREGQLAQGQALARDAEIARPKGFAGIVGESPAIRALLQQIERAKDAWSPVLIQGESGSGKELVARALHERSERAAAPFVTVSCAGLDPKGVEERLFGAVEGVGTDAKIGAFQEADGGTLFLDEIANLHLEVQATILRVVESGVYRPLGASRDVSVRFRIVSSTHRDLRELVRHERFREDLLYRLEVIHLVVPALRDRIEDVPLLVEHFLSENQVARDKKIALARGALNLLKTHSWPGNVRELHHVIERAVVLSQGGEVSASELERLLRPRFQPGAPRSQEPVTLEESEKQHIVRMLEREAGNVSRVSEILGIDRRTLQRKMKRYGLR